MVELTQDPQAPVVITQQEMKVVMCSTHKPVIYMVCGICGSTLYFYYRYHNKY